MKCLINKTNMKYCQCYNMSIDYELYNIKYHVYP